MKEQERCDYCNGTGDVMTRGLPGDEWPEACPKCNGTGKIESPPAGAAVDPHVTDTGKPGQEEGSTMSEKEKAVIDAVFYAMKSGCFFPVPEPTPPYRLRDLIQWGAMRNLHTAVAELTRASR